MTQGTVVAEESLGGMMRFHDGATVHHRRVTMNAGLGSGHAQPENRSKFVLMAVEAIQAVTCENHALVVAVALESRETVATGATAGGGHLRMATGAIKATGGGDLMMLVTR